MQYWNSSIFSFKLNSHIEEDIVQSMSNSDASYGLKIRFCFEKKHVKL